jgi:imidazolonepropionase-like amidohydrolase
MLAAVTGLGAAPAPQATLIRGARVFDGTGAPAAVANVLVQGDRIAAVGPRVRGPRGARVVDARGLTLIPGLHDLHTHLRSPAFDAPDDLGKAYAAHLVSGVTTVVDFSVTDEMLAPIRKMTASGQVPTPHLHLAIRFGVPGGHGTEYGWGRGFTKQVATPRAARLAMNKALAYRPDVIKVFADGWRYDRDPDLGSMNVPTLSAIVADAHAADVPVITHTVTVAGAKIAATAGVDSLGHSVGDSPADDELLALMKARRTGYILTLGAYEPQEDRTFEPGEWRALRPPERGREEARMAAPPEAIPEREARRWAIMQDNVRRMKAAGIRVGIGTDAGIGGVYHGSSAIREIRWLTRLGFTPAEALAAATSVSADILGRSADHGRIAPGQRADLVLTGGRPDKRIEDLHDVRRVFVAGREVALEPLRRLLESDAPSPLPVHRMAGPIDTGARADGRTDLDTLPVESTESGIDHSRLEFVRPNASANRSIFLLARMGAAPRPFAQAILPLTRGAIQLADARGFTGVAFAARGKGRFQLLLDSYGIDDPEWFRAGFDASESLGEVRIPFSTFRSRDGQARLDPGALRAVILRLEGDPGGAAWLEISNLRFF